MTENQQIIQLLTEIRDLLKARRATTAPQQQTSQAQFSDAPDRNCYAKLRDDSWGVRCFQEAKPGDLVVVFTKDNKKRTETINQVVFTGPDRRSGKMIWICSVVPRSKTTTAQALAPVDAPAAQAEAEANAAAAEDDDVPF